VSAGAEHCHPGAGEERCITCSDAAELATVVRGGEREATVELAGRRTQVAVELVGPVAPGDLLLCHAGVALELVGPA
jgi:hydrogenase maturation factor